VRFCLVPVCHLFLDEFLSRILIFTHPGSQIQIQKQQQKRGVKKIVVIPCFVATNFTKLKIILCLNWWRKNVLCKKLSLSSQKYDFGIRDPGSGKNLFRIPDPGVKRALDSGSGSATLLPSTIFGSQEMRWKVYLSGWRQFLRQNVN
jgi:hypothetical protein